MQHIPRDDWSTVENVKGVRGTRVFVKKKCIFFLPIIWPHGQQHDTQNQTLRVQLAAGLEDVSADLEKGDRWTDGPG